MDTGVLILIEMAVILGGVLAFAIWELYRLRRDRRHDDAKRGNDDPPR